MNRNIQYSAYVNTNQFLVTVKSCRSIKDYMKYNLTKSRKNLEENLFP